jgi:hypothetical protein
MIILVRRTVAAAAVRSCVSNFLLPSAFMICRLRDKASRFIPMVIIDRTTS